MFATVLKKEMLEQVVSFRFLILVLLCLSLIPLSLFVSNREYLNRVADYNRLVQMGSEKVENVQMMELMSDAFSIEGYAPPAPLGVFAAGLAGDAPDGFQSKRAGVSFVSSSSGEKSILNLTGKIDFLFIVQVVFSLLAILFTFDAVCGEREQGTLKMMLSNSIPRDSVILGKLLGVLLTMMIPFIVAFLIGIIMLILLGFPLEGGAAFARVGGLIFFSVVFMAVFACVGLIVSSLTERSKTAVVVLLFVWIMGINVIPKGAGIVAEAFVPVESDAVVDIEKSMLRRNLEMERGAEIERMEPTLPQYLPMTPENGEKNAAITEERSRMLEEVRNAYSNKIDEGLHQINLRVQSKRNSQELIARFIAQLSPVTSFTSIVTNLAGTGNYDRERFINAAEAYQESIHNSLFQYIHRDISPSGHLTMSIDNDNIDMKNLPVFTFSRSSVGETLGAITFDTIVIILFLIISFTAVYVSFLRYDVR